MSNFKKITDLPIAESTENINLIVSEDGAAKQIPANQVGAQADWNETDETSPSFIMNKPENIGGGGSVVLYFTSDSLYYDQSQTQLVYGEEFRDLILNNRILLTDSSTYGTVSYFYFTPSNVKLTCVNYGESKDFTVWDKEI